MSPAAVDLSCDCDSLEIDVLHDLLSRADGFVAKARGVTDVLRIARVERRMREFLLAKWRVRAKQAANAAGSRIAAGLPVNAALDAADGAMRKFPEDVRRRYGADIGETYRLARSAGWKKATGQTRSSLQYSVESFVEKARPRRRARGANVRPTFTLADERAIRDLADDQMIWIGEHYDSNVRGTLRTAVQPALIAGFGSQDAGERVSRVVAERLRDIRVPEGVNGTDARYFEGLAANTTTGARVRGQIASFAEAEIDRYEIVNPMDKRTSMICAHMNGKTFSVRRGVEQIERSSGARTPDELRAAHPWPNPLEAVKLTSERELANASLALPAYHFRCRSTVDVAFG